MKAWKAQGRYNSRKFELGLLSLVLTAVLGGCAAGAVAVGGAAMVAQDRRSSGAQLDDQAIELRGTSRLNEALKDAVHINLTSYNRRLLLTGEVPTETLRQLAQQTVSTLPNVTMVYNELAVMPNSNLQQRSEDTLTTGRVKTALLDSPVSALAFKVVTERGIVYLMGRVSKTEADIAAQKARAVPGVVKVVRVLELLSPEEQRAMNATP